MPVIDDIKLSLSLSPCAGVCAWVGVHTNMFLFYLQHVQLCAMMLEYHIFSVLILVYTF